MSLIALTALRSRFDSDTPLSAFFAANYSKSVAHWLGYKRFVSAVDFPVLCYVPTKTKHTFANVDTFTVSVVLGICNPDNTGTVLDGVSQSMQATELLVGALANAIIVPGLKVERDGIDVIYDLGARHPIYESELSIRLTQYDVIELGVRPSEVWLGLSPEIGTGFEGKYEQVA
ncbi:hypothetical protein JWZ98_10090 [Methylomonas sp. EFPC1]|uniref:hypothetical protein n=1 Tax=Methylomonas sp. EFPC1 TaxID=2812647 RepID=UPI001967C5F2|nr:hypothetical protein [Methylomonas sp. EFPC1]QSB03245.1 hypothetical protein JWZ98_10090 [Methylomonas sp. EFPC1]